MTRTENRYGSHIMTIDWHDNYATVRVEDLAQLRFPLIWSKQMTKEQAWAVRYMFTRIGYFEVV